MKRRRRIALIGLSVLLALSLTACKIGADQRQSEEDEGKVTITFARGKDQTEATKQIINAFEKEHPDIDVQLKEMPADTGTSHDQYVTMFSGGSDEIDVFDLDVVWPAEFAQAGYLEPLDRYIQRDKINMDDYVEGAVEAAQYNGQQWAMPKFMDTGLLYYRSDIVKEPPETWDELLQQSKEYQGTKGTRYGFIFQGKQYEGLVVNFIEYIGSYGGEVLDEQGQVAIDSKDTLQGLTMMTQIAQSDMVPGNVTTITEIETDAIYGEGDAIFNRQWPYHYALMNKSSSEVKGNVEVAPLPKGDERSAPALGGWMTGINKNSDHKQEAWEFIKFMNGPKGQKISAVDGGLAPTYMPLYDDGEVKKASPLFENEDYIQGLKAAVPRPVSPAYPKLSEIIQIEVSKTLAGEQTPKEAVKRMDRKLKAVVN